MPEIVVPPAPDNPWDVPSVFIEVATSGPVDPEIPAPDQTPYADEELS